MTVKRSSPNIVTPPPISDSGNWCGHIWVTRQLRQHLLHKAAMHISCLSNRGKTTTFSVQTLMRISGSLFELPFPSSKFKYKMWKRSHWLVIGNFPCISPPFFICTISHPIVDWTVLQYSSSPEIVFLSSVCFVCPDEAAIHASESCRPRGIGLPTGPCIACPSLIPVWLQATTRQIFSK